MASENARQVAKKVLETVRKGQKVNLGKIIVETGYSKSISESPTKVTETKTYQEEVKPVVEQLEKERQRLITSLTGKDLNGVTYKNAVLSLDLLTKNIQLLSGGNTEKTEVKVIGIDYITPNENYDKTNSKTTPSLPGS